MAQVERGANRIYGVERDRPLAWKYGTGLLLALTAGVMALLSVVALAGGAAIRDAAGWDESFDTAWLAGTIGVLLWTFLTSVALFLGLAFAAQLEAVRAGVDRPRVERDENV